MFNCRSNNFDLIRLLVAFQLPMVHSIEHLKIDAHIVVSLLGYFPGVIN